MKKIIFLFAMIMAFATANAQMATETTKFFDNTAVGLQVGATTPLDFNSVTPLNTTATIRLTKDINPYVGVNVEGTAWFNNNHFASSTFVTASNVGLNGVLNWSNIFGGYKDKIRLCEVSTVTGLGWGHVYGNVNGNPTRNYLTAKTAVDVNFNLGKNKAWQVYVEPAVDWNLTGASSVANYNKVQFNKHHAYLGLSVGVNYYFNRGWKRHNVGKLYTELADANAQINNLRTALENTKNAPITNAVATTNAVEKVVRVADKQIVTFAQNSYVLTPSAKATLDEIASNSTVEVVAYASPEGKASYNTTLSQKRATAVADYLTSKGVQVKTVVGAGVAGDDSNRIAIVKVQ